MKKASVFVLAALALGVGGPALASTTARPRTPPTDVSDCELKPGWRAYTAPSFVNLADCIGFVLGDRIGNPATPSTLIHPGSNFFVEDTNNPATQPASVTGFVYYATNSNPLFFLLVDPNGNVLYVSSEIFPKAPSVNIYELPQLVSVPAGTNVAIDFPQAESVPYTVSGTGSTALIEKHIGIPQPGDEVVRDAALPAQMEIYSAYAQYIPTSNLPFISIASGRFSYNSGSSFTFNLSSDASSGGLVFGSARSSLPTGKTSGTILCATFIGTAHSKSVVFAFQNKQKMGSSAGLWTLAKLQTTRGGAATFQQGFLNGTTAVQDCQAGVAVGTAYTVETGKVSIEFQPYN